MSNNTIDLKSVDEKYRDAMRERKIAYEKAFSSGNAMLIKAAEDRIREEMSSRTNQKAFLTDPLDIINAFDYRRNNLSLSYDYLRRMARTPIVRAIINTRMRQVSGFSEPRSNDYNTGFTIVPRDKNYNGKVDRSEINQKTRGKIVRMIDFILNCGDSSYKWDNDDFSSFLKKITNDSLTYDQLNFEVVRNESGVITNFLAVDASTIRFSNTYEQSLLQAQSSVKLKNSDSSQLNVYQQMLRDVQGVESDYGVSLSGDPNIKYVQIMNEAIVAEFYPDELAFGIRNERTWHKNYPYGESELETLVRVITAFLWAEEYNYNFFRQGSNPKGLLRYKGKANPDKLQEFKEQFMAQMSGVGNMHKMGAINAEDADFIDLQKTNKDMEYNQWVEFLIKEISAVFVIDPAEFGFPMNGSSNITTQFGENAGQKIDYSKDKGLYPILKEIQQLINKFIVYPKSNGELEFRFVGLDGVTIEDRTKRENDALKYWKTINETRREMGYEPIKGGDIIENQYYTANLIMMQQKEALENGQQPVNQTGIGKQQGDAAKLMGEGEKGPVEALMNAARQGDSMKDSDGTGDQE